jgi:glycosyltransferase involved in cell wall biosynthesis
MKTIALIEYHYGGHHATYLKLLSKALLDLGHRVMVFSSKPEEIRAWLIDNCSTDQSHVFMMEKKGKHQIPIIGDKLPTSLDVLQRWIYAASLIRESSTKIGCAPDLVFFNSLDSYFSRYLIHPIIDTVFPYKWSGLCLQENLELLRPEITRQSFSDHFITTRSSNCKAIANLDRESGQKLQAKIHKPVISFPDFTDESIPDSNYVVVEEIKRRSVNKIVVGLFGVIQKRKGVLTLIEVVQKLADEQFFFVLAGSLDESSFNTEELSQINFINSCPPPNCLLYLHRIPDGPKFNALIQAADIIFAAYENFPNSSNLLTKAAVFKKPLIVSEGFAMGDRVKQFNLGVAVPERNVERIIQALHHLCEELKSDLDNSKFKFDEYSKLHSFQKLRESITEIIDDY